MTHRTPTPIKQAIPEIVCAAIPESWVRDLIGALAVVVFVLVYLAVVGVEQ